MTDTEIRPFDAPAAPAESDDGAGEFIFRFPLPGMPADEFAHADPLIELIRGQLADLLDAVVLTDHGRRVRVDGFRLIQDPDTLYEIFPRPRPCERE